MYSCRGPDLRAQVTGPELQSQEFDFQAHPGPTGLPSAHVAQIPAVSLHLFASPQADPRPQWVPPPHALSPQDCAHALQDLRLPIPISLGTALSCVLQSYSRWLVFVLPLSRRPCFMLIQDSPLSNRASSEGSMALCSQWTRCAFHGFSSHVALPPPQQVHPQRLFPNCQ